MRFRYLYKSFLLAALLLLNKVQAQQKIALESLIPPAPNAAELGKYGTYPVGALTGIPDISFPLYTIKSGSLELPITLSYHAGGIQANQKATDVGLGWSIMAGGAISRTVYGAADNSQYGYFNYTPPSYATLTGITNYYTMAQYNIVGGLGYDLEPDLFVYNMGGKSGKFIYTINQNFLTIPFDPIKIKKNNLSSYNISFQITDENGSIYNFDSYSTTLTETPPVIGPRTTISTWYLTSIISADFTDTIKFTYETVFSTDQVEQQSQAVGKTNTTNGPHSLETYTNSITYNELLLKEIDFKNGYVQFERNTVREDVSPGPNSGGKALDYIIVYNNANQVVKKITFNHNYFKTSPFVDSWDYYRLKLTGFYESDVNVTAKKEYSFNYSSTILPRYGSYSVDYWGFANGASNSTTLIPATTIYKNDVNTVSFANGESYSNGYTYSPTETWTFGGANREPSASNMDAGILNKITYPTGGYTTFDFEPHQYIGNEYIKEQVNKTTGTTYGINKSTKSTSIYNFSFPSDLNDASVNTPYGTGTITIIFSASNMGNTEFGITQKVTLTDQTSGSELETWEHTGDLTIPLTVTKSIQLYPNHTYTFKNEIYGGTDVTINSSINWTENKNQHPIKIGGGLRIKSIKNYTKTNTLANQEAYVYGTAEDGIGEKIFNEQNFYRNYEDVVFGYYQPVTEGGACWNTSTTWQRKYLGITKYNSLNYMGSPILYPKVTKYEGAVDDNIGKTVYEYDIANDQITLPNEFVNSGNYGSINNAWNQADLRYITISKKSGSSFVPVQRKEYEYSKFNLSTVNALLFKQHKQFIKLADCFTAASGPESGSTKPGQGFFIVYQYPIKTGASRTYKETTITYDQSNPLQSVATSTTTLYQNTNNLFPTQVTVTTSDGNTKITRIKYPQDITGTVTTAMVSKNMISPVLEQKIYKSAQGIETLLSTIKTNYKQTGNLIKRDNIQASIASSPLETRMLFNHYDVAGNLLEQQKPNDAKVSYVWDYNASLPIAGATNASGSDIAYTSFEADGHGNWTYSGSATADATSPTGKLSYVLNGSNNISKSISSSVVYIVSYWTKNTTAFNIAGTVTGDGYPKKGKTISNWTYYEHKITSQSNITISETGSIDELRLYPVDAQMTTYTYDPLIGITSQCDVNNKVTYYVYDELRRLKLIKDQDKFIIKKICYNYDGQPTSCDQIMVGNTRKSGFFTKQNCTYPTTYEYVVQANTYYATDQATANTMAQDEVTANGQAFANAQQCDNDPTCPPNSCIGVDKKCINSRCRTGIKTYTKSEENGAGGYNCTYHYEWPQDNSRSIDYVETSSTHCIIN